MSGRCGWLLQCSANTQITEAFSEHSIWAKRGSTYRAGKPQQPQNSPSVVAQAIKRGVACVLHDGGLWHACTVAGMDKGAPEAMVGPWFQVSQVACEVQQPGEAVLSQGPVDEGIKVLVWVEAIFALFALRYTKHTVHTGEAVSVGGLMLNMAERLYNTEAMG